MKLILSSLLLLFAFFLSAQPKSDPGGWCGTTEKSAWLEKYQAGAYPRGEKSAGVRYVPMNVVFVGDDTDENYPNPTKFLKSMELLNSDFRNQNVQFFISGVIKYLPSTRYNRHDISLGREMMRANNIDAHLNTYVVERIDPSICGYYAGGIADAVALGRGCLGAGDRTWSHEVGHYLSLPHTFYGWESLDLIDNIDLNEPAPETVNYRGRDILVEKVDGSNCADAADGFCDTAPDYLMQRWQCTNQGTYRDSLLDPDNVRFAVPAFNIMSYANDACVTGFTDDQKGAMFANLDGRLGLVSEFTPDTVGADASQMALLAPEDGARLVYRDSVKLVWNSAPNADFYVVQVNDINNFNTAVTIARTTTDTSITITTGLRSRTDYYWRVRPVNNYVVGSEFVGTSTFRNGRQLTATVNAALDAAITVAPNPVAGGQTLRVSGENLDAGGELNYQLINTAGQVLVNRSGIQVSAFDFEENIDVSNLPAGVYFLRLRMNDRLVARRIIVTP
ncbi:zinc-dependent metalloprotease [Neolewinella antarctica]|uniref:Secretion system C-terminal sorting domain-containing protein n=1 Tax=Neolewinella antarctica TaxID=442734 RepID=A0ABX0X8N1_9BACT|nr:zinc-dependent metalloprotease [Neolewinella antarctica]NJC25309.1 hypothetical protein [Neolewinella antarctica]